MGKIDEACEEVVLQVDGARACGVMDLHTGLLLGSHTAAEHPQALNKGVAQATRDIFRSPSLDHIRQTLLSHRGLPESGDDSLQEVHIASTHSFHFAKTIRGGKAVMMLVTGKATNIGMGWAQLKASIPTVEPLIP